MLTRILMRLSCRLLRMSRSFPGRWRVVQWVRNHQEILPMCRPAVVTIAPGYRMLADPSDYDGRNIFAGLKRKDPLVDVIRATVEAGECVLDVGANLGFYTLLAASVVGSKGCVHAFEASPSIARKLEKNVSLGRSSSVVLHNKAVSNECGELEFCTAAPGHLGLSSIRDLGEGTGGREIVPAVTIDSMIGGIPPVKLVKIDVEGAEFLVLQGMVNLIERDHPYIVLELTDTFLRELGSDADQVCDWLTAKGYALHMVETKGSIRKLRRVPTDQCDIFCVHETKEVPERINVVD